jgi:threonine aldolase
MRIVDLRSDTLTRPTAAMRAAMAAAEVGDDVYGEDPTVARLEHMAAALSGKAAALFVASGTMANLVSQLSHCGRGDELILGDQSHVFYYEQGGCAAVGGIHPRTVPTQPDGTLDPAVVEAAVRGADIHFPVSRLLILENTHNRCNGTPLSVAYMQRAGALARRCGLKLHVDGARLFNAAVALGVPAAALAAPADSVAFCLSKGLAAPVGSLVCGSVAFIARARRMRKQIGGGMRQAGVLAAAGIVALEEMVARLAEDHQNARDLACALARTDGLRLDPDRVYTNIVFFDVVHPALTAAALAAKLDARGVRVLALGPRSLRAVTHYHITADDIAWTIDTIRSVLGAC